MNKLIKVVFIVLIFSAAIFTGCKKNKAPDMPSTPAGPTSGSNNTEYTFASSAEDPDQDSIAIRFAWGDDDTSGWSDWQASGDSVPMSHSWSDTGTYNIKAQAKDKKDETSDWSAGHPIKISKGTWIKTFGGSNLDEGYSVQQTTDGGYIIVGYTKCYGAGSADVYLIKTDANGNETWYKTFGGSDLDVGRSVQQTSDGGYIIAGYTWSYGAEEDVYLIKTDASGNQQWYNPFGGDSNDYSYSVQQTSDGGYIIAGSTFSDGTGSYDVYLIKTDANGDPSWTQTFGDSAEDEGWSVQQTTDGGYIIAGWTRSPVTGTDDVYLIKTDASGNETWHQTFGDTLHFDAGCSVQQTSDGGYIITGYTESYGAGSADVYLIKTKANGDETWYKTFGGSDAEVGYSVQQTSDGGYIITGYTESYSDGSADLYLIKTNENGSQQWYKKFGGSFWDRGHSVQQTSDGGYIITGYTSFSGAGDYNVYLIKTDASGSTK